MELKPCPFCGSTKVKRCLDARWISCQCCNATGPLSKEKHSELWNDRRGEPPSISADERDRLERLVKAKDLLIAELSAARDEQQPTYVAPRSIWDWLTEDKDAKTLAIWFCLGQLIIASVVTTWAACEALQ